MDLFGAMRWLYDASLWMKLSSKETPLSKPLLSTDALVHVGLVFRLPEEFTTRSKMKGLESDVL